MGRVPKQHEQGAFQVVANLTDSISFTSLISLMVMSMSVFAACATPLSNQRLDVHVVMADAVVPFGTAMWPM